MHEGTMNFTDHGEWVRYEPTVKPPHLRMHHNIMYAQRVADGMDWYVYQRVTDLLTSSTVKITLMDVNGALTVQATQRDGSMIWPASQRLIEINWDGDHEVLRRNRFDLVSGEFAEPMPDPVLRADLLIEMHHMGLLNIWEDAVNNGDVPLRLSLLAERPMTEEDEQVRTLANKLGWNREQLKQVFDAARKRIRSRHG
jgi:hypothetical protein